MMFAISPFKLFEAGLVFLICASSLPSQSFLTELQAEQNPQKRSEKALVLADAAFDTAHDFYLKGEIDKGDAKLEEMTKALNACVTSLNEAHKSKFYKKAEMNVAALQRRLDSLMDDVSAQQRGWVEYTNRKLEEIHDKLLSGVMGK